MTTTFIGQARNRVDGAAKVTGAAKYAAEYHVPGLAHGVVVSSAIARGRIKAIDASRALTLPGVIQVFTHENLPRLARLDSSYQDDIAPPGSPFRPLRNNQIKFSGQPIALIVADAFELARYASSLVRVEYKVERHSTDLLANRARARQPKEREGMAPTGNRGDADAAFSQAAIKIDVEYHTPVEHHNPMEMFASTVIYESDGKLLVYDKTQGVKNVQGYLQKVFNLREDELRVISSFVGGAFGSGLRPEYQVFLAVLAARELKRSVRVSLTRQQMFTFGHRPETIQHIALGASAEGRLDAVIHEATSETSRFEDYTENVVNWSGLLYQCENARFSHKVVPLDLYTPIDMRAPGAVWGVYAIECAMDELATRLGMDPLELRLKNYANRDQNDDLPFSSKNLRECYRQAAEKFGWATRNPEPRSMRSGASLIGWGMATAAWEASQEIASARAVLSADGKLTVASATADIGTGTYTIMTQVAAELLGLPLEAVTFKLGDSSFPKAPVEGGSFTAATVGSAVHAACMKLRKSLFALAQKIPKSPFVAARFEHVNFADGQLYLPKHPLRSIPIRDLMRSADIGVIEAEAKAQPGPNREKYSSYTHSAIFAEVKIDEDFGTIQVPRIVSAVAAGRILNPKTARSQVLGGVVWGIGSALHEESVLDQNFGRFMNHNLAEYHVPVNADVHDIDILFVEETDQVVNPLGAKGLGEIGVVGVAAAIANAVFHATGKRVRQLPITLDQIIK